MCDMLHKQFDRMIPIFKIIDITNLTIYINQSTSFEEVQASDMQAIKTTKPYEVNTKTKIELEAVTMLADNINQIISYCHSCHVHQKKFLVLHKINLVMTFQEAAQVLNREVVKSESITLTCDLWVLPIRKFCRFTKWWHYTQKFQEQLRETELNLSG